MQWENVSLCAGSGHQKSSCWCQLRRSVKFPTVRSASFCPSVPRRTGSGKHPHKELMASVGLCFVEGSGYHRWIHRCVVWPRLHSRSRWGQWTRLKHRTNECIWKFKLHDYTSYVIHISAWIFSNTRCTGRFLFCSVGQPLVSIQLFMIWKWDSRHFIIIYHSDNQTCIHICQPLHYANMVCKVCIAFESWVLKHKGYYDFIVFFMNICDLNSNLHCKNYLCQEISSLSWVEWNLY